MVGRDNVTFIFNLENRKFLVKGKQVGAVLTDIQRSSTGASQGLRTVGDAGSNAGTKMAASAVNFQTATTGMLNLSTAAVQTFTSISNLDRANNRAKMSVIAVARAEDLLNNKVQRLKEMTDAGITSGGKYANMKREIATATADLTVKEEKQAIEQAAVNDVYMLFATNIANVTISSIQTIGVLLGQEKMARLGVVAATKLQSLVLSKHVAVTVASKGATGGHIIVTKAMTFAIIKQTFATHGLTAATKLFMKAAWPLLAVGTAISALYLAYEHNVLGLKDGIDSLMGTEKTHLDIMEEERNSIDGLTASYDGLTNSIKKLSPVHEQYLTMMRDAAVNRGDSRLAASYQAQLQQPARQGNFSSGVGSPSFSGSGGTSYGGVSSGTSITQGSTIQQQAQINDINLRRESRGMSPVSYSAPTLTESPDPMGSIMQQEMFKLLTPPEQMETLTQLSISEGLKGRKGSSEEYMRKAESMRYTAESWRPRGIETDPVKAFNEIANKNTSMKATDWNKRYFPTGMSSSLKFGGDQGDGSGLAFYLQGRDKFDRNMGREIFFAGSGGEDIAKWTKQGGSFGKDSEIMNLLGLRQAEGLSFEKTQRTGFDVSSMEIDRTQSNAAQLAAYMGGASSLSETRGSTRWDARNATTLRNNAIVNSRGDSFRNGMGGLIMNEINQFKGGRMIYSSGHRDIYKNKIRIPGKDIIRQAISMGIKSRPDLMEAIKAVPNPDQGSPDNMKQAYAAINTISTIASDYVDMMNSNMSAIGFTSTIQSRANLAGYSGVGMYSNISLLAATKRTNFNNTEIIEESKSKLSLTNSQVFAIRFNSTRGDTELQDRLRYVDQLESMSSGTSPL